MTRYVVMQDKICQNQINKLVCYPSRCTCNSITNRDKQLSINPEEGPWGNDRRLVCNVIGCQLYLRESKYFLQIRSVYAAYKAIVFACYLCLH